MQVGRVGTKHFALAALVGPLIMGCSPDPPPRPQPLRPDRPLVPVDQHPMQPTGKPTPGPDRKAPRALNGPVWLYRVQGQDNEPQDLVSVLPPEDVFARGLAPEAIVGKLTRPLGEGEAITPESFARNRLFVEFLHEVIARHAPELASVQAEAKRIGEGWVYVIDARTADPRGRVPLEDILGAFEVKASRLVTGSYWRNAKHVILSKDGFFQLDAALRKRLLGELASRQVGPQGGEGKAAAK
jgi:hypothetical protein